MKKTVAAVIEFCKSKIEELERSPDPEDKQYIDGWQSVIDECRKWDDVDGIQCADHRYFEEWEEAFDVLKEVFERTVGDRV